MANVEARIEALELAVAELRGQLEHERSRIRTMRLTHVCPSCGGTQILHVRRIDQASERYARTPLSLDPLYPWRRSADAGEPLEVFVCRKCCFVEWHAPGVNKLEPDGENVIELVPDEPAVDGGRDPYR